MAAYALLEQPIGTTALMRTFHDEARVHPDAVGEPSGINFLLTITPQHCLPLRLAGGSRS